MQVLHYVCYGSGPTKAYKQNPIQKDPGTPAQCTSARMHQVQMHAGVCPAHNTRHSAPSNAISERIFAHAQRFQVPQKHTNKTPSKKTQGRLHNAPQRACTRCRCTQKRVLLTTCATQPHLTQPRREFSRMLKGFRSHKSIQTKPHSKRPRDACTMHLSAHEDGR